MSGERRLRILALMASGGDAEVTPRRVCETCRDVTGMAGAVIMVMTAADAGAVALCTAGAASSTMGELENTLGEGPCQDAFRLDRPVLEPDLLNPVTLRWTAYSGPALGTGARAVFAFPMKIGAARLGAMGLHADRTGKMSDDQHADSLVMADVAAQAILAIQANWSRTGPVADLEWGTSLQYVVHQAAGMVSAQLDVGVADAMARLRAQAFAGQRSLADLSADVVARRVRFDDPTW